MATTCYTDSNFAPAAASNQTGKVIAAFAGKAKALDLAFPDSLRKRLSRVAALHPVDWAEANAPILNQVEAIFGTWGMPLLDKALLDKLPSLKAVFYAAGTVKKFATPDFFAKSIILCNANQANAIPVAEYAVSAILLSLKRFWQHSRRLHLTRSWAQEPVPGAYRSVVGLVSLGSVGLMTAKRLAQYKLNVIAYDPFFSKEEAAQWGIRLGSLEDVFRNADVISIHAPSLPETENLVARALLQMMKPGATLINTARGAIVNEGDLCEILQERPDLTALLDVTHPEPPPKDSPLFSLSNLFLTPHISGSMGLEVSRMGEWMVEEFERYLAGESLKFRVSETALQTLA